MECRQDLNSRWIVACFHDSECFIDTKSAKYQRDKLKEIGMCGDMQDDGEKGRYELLIYDMRQ